MNEEEKIEPGSQDGKHERPVEVHSNIVQEQTGKPVETNQTSEISKSEIKEMEVYHHPKVEKKNLKEYFLEFLMIFLAVTMGFFAESLREHRADKSKEKEFMVSLKEDLVSDTTQLHYVLPESDFVFKKLDSLYFLLQTAGKGEPYDVHKLYYLNFTYGFGLLMYTSNNRTLS